jgi:hypothetical protein
VLVLWLSPSELRDFSTKTMPPDVGEIVFSGEVGGLDEATLGTIVLNAASWMSRQGLVPEPRWATGSCRTSGVEGRVGGLFAHPVNCGRVELQWAASHG